MIVLFKNQETACLNELATRFPWLLAQAQINLSPQGQQRLLGMVEARIKSNYFPSLGDNLGLLLGGLLLFPLLIKAFSNKAVSTLDTHSDQFSTPELKSIPDASINLLDGLIHTHILEHYRDHTEEARIAEEAARTRANQAVNINTAAPVANQPQLRQYNTYRDIGVARRVERSACDDINRSLSFLSMSMYLLIAALLVQTMTSTLIATQADRNTCPAPRF